MKQQRHIRHYRNHIRLVNPDVRYRHKGMMCQRCGYEWATTEKICPSCNTDDYVYETRKIFPRGKKYAMAQALKEVLRNGRHKRFICEKTIKEFERRMGRRLTEKEKSKIREKMHHAEIEHHQEEMVYA